MRPSLLCVSDGLCVRHPGSRRDGLPINCFCAEESIAHPALMLPISLLIVLPLIRGDVAEMAGSCVFPVPVSSDKQPFSTQATNNPSQ